MRTAVLAAVALLVLGLLVLVHRWLWARLVRDTTRPGGPARRVGTALAFVLPLLSLAALTAGPAGAPFLLQQVVSWPGFMWLAVLLYLTLALLVTEPARAFLLRGVPRPPEPGRAPARPAEAEADRPTPAAADRPATAAAAGPPSAAADRPDFAAAGGPASGVAGGPASAVAGGPADAEADRPAGSAADRPAPAVAGGPAPAAADRPATAAAAGPATPAADRLGAVEVGPAGGGSGAGAFGGDGISRRRFVARSLGGAAAAAALGTVGAGTYGVLRGPRVKRVRVPLAKLPRAAHGYRIAVVSDIHLGPVLGRGHTTRIVETINRTQPDLIAVVGDLVDGDVEDLAPAAEPLRRLRARHGSYFVTGNHEYFSGARQWIDEVRELGLTPLENARRPMPHFDLAGVNDVQGESEGQGPDFRAALGDRDRTRAAVLLAHQPVVIHDAVRHGVDLQLSGHTHGGQLWPGNLLAEVANPTVAGLERYGDTQLYVSRGAGAWGPPVRVGAPSDITVVELASFQS